MDRPENPEAPPASRRGPEPHGPAGSWLPAVLLFGALVAPLVLPFFGVLISLLTLALAPALGPRVWPGMARGRTSLYAGLALIAFWALPILSFAGVGLASGWFIIPLCGPANAVSWLVPAGAALAVYAAGCVVSVKRVRPLGWAVAAGLAMVMYEVVWALLATTGDAFTC